MAKITRVMQKIFGSAAGTDQRSKIGSLAAGSPAFTTDPAVMQSLSNFEQGWYGVVVGANSPAIQDLNALDNLITRQLAYIFQAGVPEWDSTTEYHLGSLVNNGSGVTYKSIINTNVGNPLTDGTKWVPAVLGGFTKFGDKGAWVCPGGVSKVKVSLYTFELNKLAGGVSSFGLATTGRLYAWGSNVNGQLGTGDVVNKLLPTAVLPDYTFKRMSAGGSVEAFTIGIDTVTGLGYSWGYNASGQLGDNTVTTRSVPTVIVGGIKWKTIACGKDHAIGIAEDGRAYGWGLNTTGQVGDVTTTPRSSPVLIAAGFPNRRYRFVSAQNDASMCIDAEGNALAWGDNSFGKLGTNDVTMKVQPTALSGGRKWKYVSIGETSGAGISEDGDLYTWGDGEKGQLGDGTNGMRSSPVMIASGKKWQQVHIGDRTVYAIDDAGDMYAWGANFFGRLGDGTTVGKSTPTLVIGGKKWLAIESGSGGRTALALASDGLVYGWGYNGEGQIGDNTNLEKSSPTLTSGAQKFVKPTLTLLNQTVVDVTPGSSYDVSQFNVMAQFGQDNVNQNVYVGCPVITVEVING